jgi:outer membrane protein assembly factor BamB
LLCVLFVSGSVFAAANWPQWRGPDRSDLSKETGLLKKWPAAGPPVVWMNKDAGLGYAGFAVVGDTLYTMGSRAGSEQLIALNLKDGSEKWMAEIGKTYGNKWGDGPRGTPSVDEKGGHVYTMGGQGNLICAAIADGKIVWKASMKDLGGGTPGWGYCESVLVDGDNVICTPGGNKGAIAALNKTTGAVVWQSKDFTDGAQYASIIPAQINGTAQYVQLTTKNVVGIDAKSGALLWKAGFPGSTAVIPTPIVSGNRVYVTAGYGAGCKLIEIGEGNKVTEIYANKTMVNHHGGVVLLGDHLYGFSDGKGWVCQDFKTGDMVWNDKKLGKGAIGYADGMLYLLDESSGTVALIEASPEAYKEVSRFKLTPQTTQRSRDGRIWTHPVITDGKLYLRDQELLFCFDVKSKTN